MKPSTFLLFLTYLVPTLAKIKYYLANSLPDSQCTPTLVLSNNTCCSFDKANCSAAFGSACGGDIARNVCPEKTITTR